MNQIATAIFAVGIVGLFVLDRDRRARSSIGLWIPTVWLLIAGSRNVSEWLEVGPPLEGGAAYLEGNPLDRIVLSSLIGLGIMVLFARGPRTVRLLKANAPILLYFFYCGISILWSDYPDVSLKRWIRASGDLVMVLVVLSDRDWVIATKRLMSRVGFLLVPLSFLLIRYYPDLGRTYSIWDGRVGWTGVTTSKNLLGMVCLIVGLSSAWRLIQAYSGGDGTRKAGPRIAQATLLGMAVLLMWQVDSVTSLSCFLMAGGVMTLTSQSAVTRRPIYVHVLVIGVVFVAFSVLFLHIGTSLVEGMGRDSTLTGRDEIWNIVLNIAKDPLLGTGFESFWLGPRLQRIWSIHGSHFNQAHNGYLEVYLNLGWFGVTLLAIVIVTGYRSTIAAVCRHGRLASLMLAYFVVGVIYNFTEGAFKMMHPVWFCFLLAIMAVPEAMSRPMGIVKKTPHWSTADFPQTDSANADVREEVI